MIESKIDSGNVLRSSAVFRIQDYVEFVALDIETTGLNSATDEIIEIAAIKYVQDGNKHIFNSFVKPRNDVPHYIEYLTHISPSDLSSAPMVKEVLLELKKFVGNSVIVGHNTAFDLDFINVNLIEMNELPLLNQWWDTSELGRIYLPFTSNHKLATLCKEFGINLEQAHRAMDDAEATGQLFLELLKYIISYTGVLINARILELCRQAQLSSNLASLLEMVVDFQRKNALTASAVKKVPARHNIIENKCLKPIVQKQDAFFSPSGILKSHFDFFEYRAGQLVMAQSIESALVNREFLVVEAGTGVGKSFAYLIPALQYAYSNSKKVVVSTNTKNLQEQLFYKDLPALQDILQIPYKAVLVKGRENYICERKWDELIAEQSRGLTAYEAAGMLYLLFWKLNTKTGDITENSSFDRNRFSILWRRIGSDRHYCAGRKCPHFNHCYVMKLRKHVEDSSLVVINHSLLLSDLKSNRISLGDYDTLIIDEAHNIMHTASRQLGIELSYAEIINQLNQVSKLYKKKNVGLLDQIEKAINKSVLTQAVKEHIGFIIKNIEDTVEKHRKIILDFFDMLSHECENRGYYGKLRVKVQSDFPDLYSNLKKLVDFWKDYLKQIHNLSNVFSGLNGMQLPSYDILYERIQGFELRAVETENDLLSLLNPDFNNYACWIETDLKSDKNIPTAVLCYAPIEVNEHLNNIVYKNVTSIIFTSATMALRNSFKFYLHQSGLDLLSDKKLTERVVESPFDYPSQAKLFVAGFLPEPDEADFFLPQALDLIDLIIESVPVGTMTLFTSYRDLDTAYNKLNDKLYQKNRPLFAQGKWSSRSALLDEFKKHNNAVLLGTNSFWEGIDVQGESLSLLILFKLPFQVPTEPIIEAYIEKLDKDNKNSFMHFMLPNALLKLRQGFGRLIRSKSDYGVVVIIDPRVATKKYGHFFQEVLPATSVIVNDPLELQSSVIEVFKHKHSFFR
jgi:predicted DnaQ family exonuclease/DinG family helicase